MKNLAFILRVSVYKRSFRIYKRSQQSSTIDLESNLNGLDWMSFETPKTLEHGSDFLIQKSSTSRNWKTRSNMAGYRVEY